MWSVLRPGTQWLADSSRHRPRACSYAAALAYLELWLYTERSAFFGVPEGPVGSAEVVDPNGGGGRVNKDRAGVRGAARGTGGVTANTTVVPDSVVGGGNGSEANNVRALSV